MRDKKIILCADDYGLAPGIGIGIRQLIDQGRVTATGCMTVSPFWPEEARKLGALSSRADIGLHFTLTDHQPLGPMPSLAPDGRLPPLGRLMARAFLGRLDPDEIAGELERQIDRFAAELGRPPDFIDGHHHVHQLPGVRGAVAAAFLRRVSGGYVRYCAEPMTSLRRIGVATKRAAVISLIGAGWARRGRRSGIPGNRGFRGVRGFTEPSYAALLPRWLERAEDDLLIMCHPGQADDALRQVEHVVDQREEELRVLAGDAFGAALRAAGITLSRGRGLLAGTIGNSVC